MPSMRLGTRPIIFRTDFNTSPWPFVRLIKELPLILVCLTFAWAQYTLAFSLVFSYLLLNRKLYGLGFAILVPFEISWVLAVSSLVTCITTGPGWVKDMSDSSSRSNDTLENGYPPNSALLEPTRPDFEDRQPPVTSDVLPSSSRGARRFPHPYAKPRNPLGYSGVTQEDEYEDEDEEDDFDLGIEGATPLLPTTRSSSSTSKIFEKLQPHLEPRSKLPRPSSSSLLPAYPVQPLHLPPSTMSFQEQVRAAEQRSTTRFDILSALNSIPPPPPPPFSSPFQPSAVSGIDTLMCKSDGSKRFCRKCNLLKADRAHHCSSCKKCVLRMDHHCPWLGGRCVGLHNQKYFVLFLIWTSITSIICAFGAVNGLSEFVTINANLSDDGFRLAPLNWAFLLLVGALFGMVLTGFGSYHLYLVSVNRTTIENMERSLRVRPTVSSESSTSYALLRSNSRPVNPNTNLSRSAETVQSTTQETLPSYDLPVYKSDDRLTRSERKKLESGSTKLNVYDLGSRLHNFKEVFGHHNQWWEWPLPLPPKGISNGYEYRVNTEHLAQLRELTAEVRLLPSNRTNELRFERP
ncbi:hypothetical protein CROQUDRAFT_669388 [Cronartium quercuum f. sp. fusiforme G11]|uniref:Palmitoyltransferase n=1 Tax=Cronartium quercuum f. sp. fusiforme G11 TaxID=708437 RepID=A0A9P6NRU7_9BASI|nr:hypothetical protein CROQUDRAFT_669388 [Cronartium quercuum f. sp. fusiforme G11]